MKTFTQFVERCKAKPPKIAVIGDALIDKYYNVKVNRISPEFPIEVMWSNWEGEENPHIFPGGAGNVCNQMKHWNAKVFLVSAIDHQDILANYGFNTDYCVEVGDWKSPEKRRYYDGDFPICRHDIEDLHTDGERWFEVRCQIIKNTKELIEKENIDVVILSDYGKGVFSKTDTNVSQEIIQFCRERNVTTIVDPKTLDYEYWQGCDIFKPNSQYVKNFVEKFYSTPIVGDSSLEWERRSIIIQERIKCKNLLITDSGNGIHVKDQEKYRHYGSQELSFTRPVIRSVIGAGDCFCSFLALAISEGFDLFTSSRLAFNAASCYIQDKHNNPITKHQLRSWFDPHAAKIVSLDDLLEIQADNPNEVFVMTNGCFDCGLTNGHIECLQFAKNRGTKLVVAMNSDDSVQRLKGPERPIMPLKHRMNIMAAVSFVDFIVAFDEDTPIKVVEKLRPKYIVKGGDYKQEDVAGYGISDIVIFPLVESISTTEKIKKLELNTV
jgi:D-beta-D-heptose 7-phosphate kinase/D-beta-D-heptose 1-phosphate adenosyltransferase